MDYNVNAGIYCFEILILTYSDFTFDNVNFHLWKRSGFEINIATFKNMSFFLIKVFDLYDYYLYDWGNVF